MKTRYVENEGRRLLSSARKARLCEEYLRLRSVGFSGIGASRALNHSASLFSGAGSMLARYLTGGVSALDQRREAAAAGCELSSRIEALGWFIPAASFFFFSAKGRRALRKAIRRTIALPELPTGWRADTRATFLRRLALDKPPRCPEALRADIEGRLREGRAPVPWRIARKITTSPALALNYTAEVPVKDLAAVPFGAVVARLGSAKPGGLCRLSIELL